MTNWWICKCGKPFDGPFKKGSELAMEQGVHGSIPKIQRRGGDSPSATFAL